MQQFFQDFRYAVRVLGKEPGLTLAAVLSIALGVAANTTVFTMANKVLFQPLPVQQPHALYSIYGFTHKERPGSSMSFPNYLDLRGESAAIKDIAAYFPIVPGSLESANGQPRRLWGQIVTGNYFDVAGVTAFRGRTFLPAEDQVPDRDLVVVLSHQTWNKHLGGDSSIVGRTIRLNQQLFTVVGIAPPEFRGTDVGLVSDFWIPMALSRTMIPAIARSNGERLSSREHSWINTIARLQPGVSQESAQTALHTLASRLAKEYPSTNQDRSFYIERAGQFNPSFRGPVTAFLSLLLTVMFLVLLIACANVANLLLARAAKRSREIGTRLAVGASRGRLIRQLLSESLLLAACGSVAAVALTRLAQQGIARIQLPFPVPVDFSTNFDWRVAAFTLSLTLLTTLLFGLAPALRATRTDLITALRVQTSDGSPTRNRFRSANLLVAGQIGVAMLLLIGTVLMLRSLQQAHTIPLGFTPQQLIAVAIDPALDGRKPIEVVRLLPQIQQRLTQLPGVEAVSYSDMLPLSIGGQSTSVVSDTENRKPERKPVTADIFHIGAGYLKAMGISLTSGSADLHPPATGGPIPALINQALAAKLFPNGDPIGRQFFRGGAARVVVGTVPNSKIRTIGEATRPAFYELLSDSFRGDAILGFNLMVRVNAPVEALIQPLRQAMASAFPNVSVYEIRGMEEHIAHAQILPRMGAVLFGFAGGCALLLSLTGLFGVVHYSVSRRSREIGILMALGAEPQNVVSMILSQGMKLAACGSVLGLAAALATSRLLSSVLYGISPLDAVTFTLVPAVLLAAALLAALLPAWRASRMAPSMALREE